MSDLFAPRNAAKLDALRDRLADAQGPEYWRSLDELAHSEDFQQFLYREFPPEASEWSDPVGRRNFLKLMAASIGLAGLQGCVKQPEEKIVPYVRAPEQMVPGKPLFFATAMTLAGYARGVLVESHMGRPTKIEGNPDHPASLGATDAFMQASILSLYDPDRSQTVMRRGSIDTWDRFLTDLSDELSAIRARRGAGLSILTETVTSPTLGAQLGALLDDLPEAKWHQYEPLARHWARAGARLAFGEDVDTEYYFDRASLIVSLDAEFLVGCPDSLRYARQFIDGRRISGGRTEMNRLYAIESTPSLTGAMADHRLAIRPSHVEQLARWIAGQLGVEGVRNAAEPPPEVPAKWLSALFEDLKSHRGSGLVIAGDAQPPVVHAIVHAINQALGNVGNTVEYSQPSEARPIDQLASLSELVADMRDSHVRTLIMLGGNPAYNAPAGLAFEKALDNVSFRVHLSEYFDETSALCHWHVPAAHYLEAWSDARADDGTVTIVQPLIAPLYGGKTSHELVSALAAKPEVGSFDIVQDYWRRRLDRPDFGDFWARALHDGIVPDTKSERREPALRFEFEPAAAPLELSANSVEVVVRGDPTVWDGRFANNGWLQELPKPLTKLTWDTTAQLSLSTARRLKVQNEDVIELEAEGRKVQAPVWICPGHADDCVTLTLGYGRTRAGRVGTKIGYSAYELLGASGSRLLPSVSLKSTGRRYNLSTTQNHWSMEGRNLVQVTTLAVYLRNPQAIIEPAEKNPRELPSLYPADDYEGQNAWGMSIDQTACIGCNACVVACQAENNIPVVGKAQVARGREMHWLRIDRYYKGPVESPEAYFQPVLCMHCEKAPCELVCPVAATVHDSEGLNAMVYNRCVGTRYCSNNCPYKVRRFNFFEYNAESAPVLKLLHNPDVTVRSRGVMEKCTYCVQRISAARIESKKDSRAIRDGEVVTACQAACPTQAIVFGNVNDRDSAVHRLKSSPLDYSLLAELNTRPRTTYLARVLNPHPALNQERPADTPQPVDPSSDRRGEAK